MGRSEWLACHWLWEWKAGMDLPRKASTIWQLHVAAGEGGGALSGTVVSSPQLGLPDPGR